MCLQHHYFPVSVCQRCRKVCQTIFILNTVYYIVFDISQLSSIFYKKNFLLDSFEFIGTIITYPYPGALHLYPRGYIRVSRPILLGVLPTNLVNTLIFIIYFLTGIHVYVPPLLTLAVLQYIIYIYLYIFISNLALQIPAYITYDNYSTHI